MFYDGGCSLCRAEVHHYRRLDRARAVHWVDISRQADQLGSFCLTEDTAMARLHVLDQAGKMQTGAAAFAALWSALPYYRWLARFVRFPGILPLLERVYEPFARWRLARRRNNCSA